MSDIAHAVEVARRHPDRPRVAVDNTFLGPVFQHPLDLGVDLVVYSATKFLGGFSDMLGGVVMSADVPLVAELRGLRALFGNILQADESWILNSRLSTVALRMNRQSKNAQKIAERLADHPRVKRVFYPSLFTDPEQKRLAEESKEKLAKSGKFDRPIVTEITATTAFYPAEEYHQDYHKKNPLRYNAYKVPLTQAMTKSPAAPVPTAGIHW